MCVYIYNDICTVKLIMDVTFFHCGFCRCLAFVFSLVARSQGCDKLQDPKLPLHSRFKRGCGCKTQSWKQMKKDISQRLHRQWLRFITLYRFQIQYYIHQMKGIEKLTNQSLPKTSHVLIQELAARLWLWCGLIYLSQKPQGTVATLKT